MTTVQNWSAADPYAAIRTSNVTDTEQTFQDALADSQVERTAQQEAELAADNSLGSTNDESEDRFLALLVAQLQNQDPLNPLDNAEVTTQLAQINTVRGIEDMGKTMTELLSKFDDSNPVDAAGMVGRSVLIASSTMTFEDGTPAQGGVQVEESSSAVDVGIYGDDGKLMRTIALGPQPQGVATFEWDGTNEAGDVVDGGHYTFQVLATSADGTKQAQGLSAVEVLGVTRNGESLAYRVEGGTTVASDSVHGVF